MSKLRLLNLPLVPGYVSKEIVRMELGKVISSALPIGIKVVEDVECNHEKNGSEKDLFGRASFVEYKVSSVGVYKLFGMGREFHVIAVVANAASGDDACDEG